MLVPALTDYNAAIENLFARNPHDGQCKWSALQFAEKAMKQRLVELGETPKFTHDLQKLGDALLTHGIQVDAKLIGDVQCEAGVRYGQPQVSRLEAVTSVQSALRIYAGLFSPDAFEFSHQPQA